MTQENSRKSQADIIRNALEKYRQASPKTNQLESDPCDQLVYITQELFLKDFVTNTSGNLSIRSTEGKVIWITPSQLPKKELQSDMIVLIDLEGNKLDQNPYQPSSEKFVHTEIYKARPEIQAVIHAHPIYATALALSELPFLPISTEAAIIDEIPRVPFVMPGTTDLAETVVKAMGIHSAVLMQNHGIVVAASSLRKAVNILEIIEHTSKIIITCYSTGIEPPTLPNEVVTHLHDFGDWMA